MPDQGLINCIHPALFFTKDIAAHITPNNAELACLDPRNSIWFKEKYAILIRVWSYGMARPRVLCLN